ncbi:MAG: sporulation initiation factor Spo0A C-terminal domain-containing protein, partial [Lachnospiraceae bacterium]
SKKPYILVTTNNSSTTTLETARALGADYIMSKHQKDYSSQSVLDFLRIMLPTIKSFQSPSSEVRSTPETAEQYTKRIYRRIMTELNHVGINPKSVGYAYLADAIYFMVQQPTQDICTVLAEKYNKSEASIERAMQNAIHRAWKTQDIDTLLKYYKAKISSAKGNPTLTEFICYYANELKNNY